MTSHWHMAIADAALKREEGGHDAGHSRLRRECSRGWESNIVHLAEFHGDGHPKDPGPLRLAEMQAMFQECDRLSDNELLFLPGEEANSYLGKARPGKEAGHWMYLFPKPVYWTMNRGQGQAFVEDDSARTGRSITSGPGDDMQDLLEREGRPGLDGPRPHQGLELDARRLPQRRDSSNPTTGWGPHGKPCRPTCRTTGSAAVSST